PFGFWRPAALVPGVLRFFFLWVFFVLFLLNFFVSRYPLRGGFVFIYKPVCGGLLGVLFLPVLGGGGFVYVFYWHLLGGGF
ncbi:hypothetical protein ACQWHL_25135, partial [Salmonella enterica subsp. enterica serovar Infantis]